MTKQKLMETYTTEQLAEMVVELQNGKENKVFKVPDNKNYQKKIDEFFKDSIDKICKDILEQKDNTMAMEFTRIIGQLLRENGVFVRFNQTEIGEDIHHNIIERKYGITFDNVDFSEHDKEFTAEIERLKCELKDLQIKIEEEYRPLEIEIENLRRNERELSKENAELHCELQAIAAITDEIPTEPIKVADMLINASKKRTNCMTGKEYDKYIFDKWQLRQIAEHLLVYCNHNGEEE